MSIIIPALPADLPEDFQWEDVIAPNGADIGRPKQRGYNYLMQQMNETQRAVVALAEASDETFAKKQQCVVINGKTILPKNPIFIAEDAHPNELGMQQIAQALLKYIPSI